MKRIAYALALLLAGAGLHAVAQPKPAPGGYIIEHDADIAKAEPGTHNGGGQTIGYSFLEVPNLKLVFRKRAFKAGIGRRAAQAEGRRDLLRAERQGHDDAGRHDRRHHAGHGVLTRTGSTQLSRSVTGSRHHDQLQVEPRPATPAK
jgi:hypothetical protein